MVNYLQVGLDAVRLVSTDPRVNVPILGHSAGAAMLDGGIGTGMGSTLFNALLPRLCGIDMVIFLTYHGKFLTRRERCLRMAGQMQEKLTGIRPMLPIAAGGVDVSLVDAICTDYGCDIALGVGGPLFGYPEGARAGATAIRQAIETFMKNQKPSSPSPLLP